MYKDITNMRSGKLVAIERTDKKDTYGRCYLWRCKCDCGNEVFATTYEITHGLRTSCGCGAFYDISGQKFGRLTAIRRTGEIRSGSAVWELQCECGNVVNATLRNLVQGYKNSCGCLERDTKQKQAQKNRQKLGFIDGTCIASIRSDTIFKNNSTGVRGVSFKEKTHKYIARITFKGKTYSLGSYEKLEDAARARKEAEEKYFGTALQNYEKLL